MIRPSTSSIVSSKHNKPTSTPALYSKTPRHTLESSSHILNLNSDERHSSSHIRVQSSSALLHQTPISSSINTYPPVSSVVPTDPQVLPSHLVFFHAFGTLEFHHLSGLNYYANGTLKVRAPVTTQFFNSASEIKQSIAPTVSINNNNFSSTRIFHRTISPSPSSTKISTTLLQSSMQPEVTSSTLGLGKVTSTFLQTSTLSTVNTGSSLVPTAATSSMPNMVSSSAVMTTRKWRTPLLTTLCNQACF